MKHTCFVRVKMRRGRERGAHSPGPSGKKKERRRRRRRTSANGWIDNYMTRKISAELGDQLQVKQKNESQEETHSVNHVLE